MEEDKVKKPVKQKTPRSGSRNLRKIKDSEVRYRRLFETAQDGILILDAETGQIKDVNPYLAQLLGFSREEFLGKKLWEIGLFKDIAANKESFTKLQSQGYVRYENLPLETKSGEAISVEFVSNVYQIEGEKVIQCNIRDITARKKAENALRELEIKYRLLSERALVISEETLRLVVESLIVGITVTDLEGTILQTNKATVLLHAFHNKEEIIGRNSLELVDKVDRDTVRDRMKRIFEDGYLKDIEFTLLRADGTNFAGELSAAIIKDVSGTPQGIVITTKDITERKQAEKVLRQNESKYRELTESISDVFFAMDRDLKYTYWNKASEKLTGIPAADAIGKPFTNVFPENETTNSLQDTYRKAMLNQVPLRFTTEYPGEQNLIHEISVYPSIDGISVFLKDVTESKRMQEELELSNKALLKVMQDTIQAMAATCEMRDPYTAGHQQKAAKLAVAIAEELHLSNREILGLRVAALIHDIGKMSIPAEILSKPGKLAAIEFSLVKMHVEAGYNILQLIDFPWPVAQIVYQHHERMDGSGYPNGLKGNDIKIEARILVVADVVEAMTSFRPYRAALGIEKALAEVSENRGRLYDANVVDACQQVISNGFKFE